MMNRLFCLALAGASCTAHALTYVETTDLPNTSSFGTGSVSVGTLDLGTNRVSGGLNGFCISGGCNSPPGNSSGDSQDSFLFTVAAGTVLQSLSLDSRGTAGPNGFSAGLLVRSANATFTSVPSIPLNALVENVLAAPLGAGVYSLSIFGQQATASGSYQLPYTLSFSGAVPEPSTALLLLFGSLLTAGWWTAARRSATHAVPAEAKGPQAAG